MKKKIFSVFLIIIILSLSSIAACDKTGIDNNNNESGIKSKHAMVIGIDGLMPAAVKTARTPYLDELIENGSVSYDAYAGGILGTPTQQATSSGPSWSSILTGVWVDKHNVPDNDFANPNYDEYPCFFKRLKEQKADAYCSSIVQWTPINTNIVTDADYKEGGTGGGVAIKTISHLNHENPDIIFLHFDDVDGAGHSFGYSPDNPPYLEVISKVDSLIGIVMRGIKNRSNYKNEDWLILAVSDHGGIGTGHGGQTIEERSVLLLASGGAVKKGVVSPGPGIVAVPPTIFKHLDIPVDTQWGWVGQPFGYE